MTKYEREIHRMITLSKEHLTAEQLYMRLKEQYPGVAMATVYNNLNRLWKAGLIRRVSMESMPDRYDRAIRHDHLVCRSCGKLADITFQDLTDFLREQAGEEVLSYDLKAYYLCPRCRADAKPDLEKDPPHGDHAIKNLS